MPPRSEHPETPEEQRGHEIFTSDAAKCARCHVPQTEYTDRTAYPLGKRAQPADFDDEPRREMKTPSLLFVGGRAPYFHDGSAATLPEAVHMMGRYQLGMELSEQEVEAIVTWLGALDGAPPAGYVDPPPAL